MVWRVLRNVKPTPSFKPWLDFIDNYLVDVPGTIKSMHKYYTFPDQE
jgi:hypothetical protein